MYIVFPSFVCPFNCYNFFLVGLITDKRCMLGSSHCIHWFLKGKLIDQYIFSAYLYFKELSPFKNCV